MREARWLKYLVSDLVYGDVRTKEFGNLCDRDFARVQLSEIVDPNEKPMCIFEDNKGAIALSRNSVLHKRSKHIHIGYHIVRREVERLEGPAGTERRDRA